jgi:hypothetical protein
LRVARIIAASSCGFMVRDLCYKTPLDKTSS